MQLCHSLEKFTCPYGLMHSVEYSLECVLVDKFPPGHPIRTSFYCLSWQFQTVSIYFHVFYVVPHEHVREMKILQMIPVDNFKNQ